MSGMSQRQQQQQNTGSPSATTPTTSDAKHWSQRKHESVVSSELVGVLVGKVRGGSDSGQFVYLNETSEEELVKTISGRLFPGEILLEVQGKKVSGFTLYDVVTWLKQLAKAYPTITLRTVQTSSANNNSNLNANQSSGSNLLLLPLELRAYLDERFQKGSVDYDLQQVIRENVYMRTVPCTTRKPRPGEIDGHDYIFLSNEEFLELEQVGDLLEYGVYNGHYYGTPKPPKEPKTGANSPYSAGAVSYQTKRNNSLTDMSAALHSMKRPSSVEASSEFSENSDNGRKVNDAQNVEIIPYGWEKVEDPEYGTFYIDHINKQTTYENPFMHQQQQQQQQQPLSSMKTFKPSDDSMSQLRQTQQQQQQRRNIFFTRNPAELKGEFLKTCLQKSAHGFGFTIIGANETSEDFLQIKYIVPEGAAHRDGCLRQGDVLVYVNNECVLGYTHQDVVEIFQSIPVGNSVELTVCRGYPLSIDPNDPNIEIMPLPAINPQLRNGAPTPNQQAPLASVDELNSLMNSSISQQTQQQQQQHQQMEPTTTTTTTSNTNDEYFCEEYEEMFAPIVKGPKGFGFTIADDAQMNHQKVKQILDRERCCNLSENDILLEINGVDLRGLGHGQVVDVLKECPRGLETVIRLKRRKYQIVLPKPPSSSGLLDRKTLNGQKEPTEEEYKEFRPISALKNINPLFHNSHQLAFNYERRSKTPNILQSSVNSQSNLMSSRTPVVAPLQLRSKTPTTDRLLFSNDPNNANDYMYLNGTQSNKTTRQQQQQQQQQQPMTELYSTVSKSTRTDFKTDVENVEPHCPIYDQTTNLQHQRLVSSKINATREQQLIANRSKTPGPDMIYFRNESASSAAKQLYPSKAATISAATGNGLLSRSKTPTADMMYYPVPNSTSTLIPPQKRAGVDSSMYGMFEPVVNEAMWTGDGQVVSDVDGNSYLEMVVELFRQESGFGFRIVGGEEEGSQVAVGYIVQSGAAHLDGRLRPNDEIVMIDGECVLGATHRRVVQLMTIAGLKGVVKLIVRRKITSPQINTTTTNNTVVSSSSQRPSPFLRQTRQSSVSYPHSVTLYRNGNEGFGFVIISTLNKTGPSIGKIVENSPADRSKRLHVGDRILAVNGINITQMNHIEIVKLIKESENSITLTIGAPVPDEPDSNFKSSADYAANALKMSSNFNRQFVSPTPQTLPAKATTTNIGQNEYHVIELRKHAAAGFGFSIRGGKEFNIPLFVLKIADQGPAAMDGRLQVGDQILEINGCDAYHMTHSEAIERIKSGGGQVTLLIRRTGMPPPSITDIIAANATAAVASAQQMNTNSTPLLPSQSTNQLNNAESKQTLRPKSPYLPQQLPQQQTTLLTHNNQQFKHFNSTGTLVNRY